MGMSILNYAWHDVGIAKMMGVNGARLHMCLHDVLHISSERRRHQSFVCVVLRRNSKKSGADCTAKQTRPEHKEPVIKTKPSQFTTCASSAKSWPGYLRGR